MLKIKKKVVIESFCKYLKKKVGEKKWKILDKYLVIAFVRTYVWVVPHIINPLPK